MDYGRTFKGSGTWNWAQKLMSSDKRRREFVRMRGPRGKGCAEMAVARVASCGFETPMSENGYDMQGRMSVVCSFPFYFKFFFQIIGRICK